MTHWITLKLLTKAWLSLRVRNKLWATPDQHWQAAHGLMDVAFKDLWQRRSIFCYSYITLYELCPKSGIYHKTVSLTAVYYLPYIPYIIYLLVYLSTVSSFVFQITTNLWTAKSLEKVTVSGGHQVQNWSCGAFTRSKAHCNTSDQMYNYVKLMRF